jgi:hypothetical protein
MRGRAGLFAGHGVRAGDTGRVIRLKCMSGERRRKDINQIVSPGSESEAAVSCSGAEAGVGGGAPRESGMGEGFVPEPRGNSGRGRQPVYWLTVIETLCVVEPPGKLAVRVTP